MTAADGVTWGDEPHPRPVQSERTRFAGRVFDVVTAQVDLGEPGVVTRDFLRHPGAVAVVAVRPTPGGAAGVSGGAAGTGAETSAGADDAEVLLLRQYRVPVGAFLWEIPAGLTDGGAAETLLDAAQRELAEEADLVAGRWDVLADFATTPGASDEVIRVFLARDVAPAPDSGYVREGEEAEIELAWVPLTEAAHAVTAGRMHSPSAVVGVLAAALEQATGWQNLRSVTAPFPLRPDKTPA